eukprot:296771-Amphidinium_carterae.1
MKYLEDCLCFLIIQNWTKSAWEQLWFFLQAVRTPFTSGEYHVSDVYCIRCRAGRATSIDKHSMLTTNPPRYMFTAAEEMRQKCGNIGP